LIPRDIPTERETDRGVWQRSRWNQLKTLKSIREVRHSSVPRVEERNLLIIKDKNGICTTQQQTLWGNNTAFCDGNFLDARMKEIN
jgi:hypothetical protein